MAPEQFLGEHATPATDIFSLAVIAYEMATGFRPWPSENLIQSAVRRVGRATPALDCGPGIPREWNRMLERALAREPQARPNNAADFVAQLQGAAPHLPGRRSRGFVSRRTMISAAATATLSCIYAFYRYRRQAEPIRGEPILMLAPMEHPAGYESSKALDFLMQTQLRQSAHIQILDAQQIDRAWKRMHPSGSATFPERLEPKEAREIALLAGAHFVLFSSITRTGDDYTLAVKLEALGSSPAYPASSRPRQFERVAQTDLMATTREASNWIRSALGELPPDIAARSFPPEELATGNWRALQEFLQAEELWRKEIHGRSADEAIRRLKAALNDDPGFALAAGRLGDLLVAVGQIDEGLRDQQIAIRLMEERDLTDAQSLRIRGLYYQDTGQDEKAEDLFSFWASQYPNQGLPLFYKSKSVMRLGREQEGYALRRRAAELEPDNYALRLGAAQA
jgi:hypothetical protein